MKLIFTILGLTFCVPVFCQDIRLEPVVGVNYLYISDSEYLFYEEAADTPTYNLTYDFDLPEWYGAFALADMVEFEPGVGVEVGLIAHFENDQPINFMSGITFNYRRFKTKRQNTSYDNVYVCIPIGINLSINEKIGLLIAPTISVLAFSRIKKNGWLFNNFAQRAPWEPIHLTDKNGSSLNNALLEIKVAPTYSLSSKSNLSLQLLASISKIFDGRVEGHSGTLDMKSRYFNVGLFFHYVL